MKLEKSKYVNMVSTLIYSNLIDTQEHQIRKKKIRRYGKYTKFIQNMKLEKNKL